MADETATQTPESSFLRDILYIVFKRKVPILALGVVGTGIIAYGLATVQPEYEAQARILIKRLRPGYVMPAEPEAVLKSSEVVNTEIRILTSSTVCAEVVDRLGLAAGERERSLEIERLEKQLRPKVTPDTDVIDVFYRDTDPHRAADVVNAALDAYLEVRKRLDFKEESIEYLEKQAERARAARDSVGALIAEYGGREGALATGLRGEMHMGIEDGFLNDVLDLRAAVAAAEEKIALMEAWLQSERGPMDVPTADIYELGTVRVMHQALLQLETQLARMRSQYAPDDPQIRAVEREIRANQILLRGEVERAVAREKMRLEERRTDLRAVERNLASLRAEDMRIAKGQVDIRMLEHDMSIWADLYALVADRLEEHRITAATDPSLLNVSILSRATVPARPTPRTVNMKVVVGVFTIVFGVLLVLALEKADQSFGRREDVQSALGVRVLASIPDRAFRRGR